MSNINTSGINTNYPVPGVNNSTQGFRDNFASTRSALDTASVEISDLQSKAVVKNALNGTTINNDMANTMISNAAVHGFRYTSYNMGGSLPMAPDTIVIDCTKADVHYGQVVGDTNFIFAGWAPSGTQQVIQMNLLIANNQAKINFPDTVYNANGLITTGMSDSMKLMENFSATYSNGAPFVPTPGTDMANVTHTNNISAPAGAKEMVLELSTLDCGSTINIRSLVRSHKATQIAIRDFSTDIDDGIGKQGDTKGSICTDGSNMYICVADYDGSTNIWRYVPLGTWGQSYPPAQ
jgi:hypothetical protein